jgi:hypothetical protein
LVEVAAATEAGAVDQVEDGLGPVLDAAPGLGAPLEIPAVDDDMVPTGGEPSRQLLPGPTGKWT